MKGCNRRRPIELGNTRTLWGTYISYRTTDLSLTMVSDSNPGGGYSSSLRCSDFEAGHVFSPPEGMDEDVFYEQIERHRDLCENLDEEERRFREEMRQRIILPGSLSNSLGIAHAIGVILIVILGPSSMGVEYGWGTLRAVLTRGIGRWQFLGAKVLSLLLLSAVGFIIAGLTVAASSLVAASLVLDDGGGLADAGEWSTVAVMFGKAVYGLAPYAILALFLSVLTSSSSMGIAIGLAYYFAESILVQILGGPFGWFSTVTDFLLGPSVTSWMTETGVRATGGGAMFPVNDPSSQMHAFFVIAAYIVVLGVAAFWLFMRKDIAGATGE